MIDELSIYRLRCVLNLEIILDKSIICTTTPSGQGMSEDLR